MMGGNKQEDEKFPLGCFGNSNGTLLHSGEVEAVRGGSGGEVGFGKQRINITRGLQ